MIAYSQCERVERWMKTSITARKCKLKTNQFTVYTKISGAPLERLLTVLEASTGEALSNKLLETLEQLGLSTDQLVGQALGWCSNLKGDIMETSESHKGHVSAGTIYMVLVTLFTICHEGPSIKYVTLEGEGVRGGVTVCDRGRRVMSM